MAGAGAPARGSSRYNDTTVAAGIGRRRTATLDPCLRESFPPGGRGRRLANTAIMTLSRYPVAPEEVEWSAVRAQGAGGQNVNKVSNAAQLRFDVRASRLPEAVRLRLERLGDQRIGKDGVIVIKAQEYRSLERNRAAALRRLQALVDRASTVPARRIPTRPTASAVARRLEAKTHRARTKRSRGRISDQ